MHKDRSFLPALAWVGLAIASSALALASGVQAQTPQGGPKAIEIAGVRLGMPREEAVKALMANQPPLEVKDNGILQLKVPALSPDAFVWSIEFEAKRETPDTPFERMDLDFTPPPSGSTVVTLRRSISFDIGEAKTRAPTAANFLEAVDKRFGANASNINRGEVSNGRHQSRTFVWNRAGSLLSEQEYQQRWKHYSLSCDISIRSARSQNGINFRAFEGLKQRNVIDSCAAVAVVSWEQDENRIIKRFSIAMTDAAAILEAFTKAAEVIEEKDNRQRNQELDRATKNRTKL
jgi:hypothetical protein